jgi:hypothetical protein
MPPSYGYIHEARTLRGEYFPIQVALDNLTIPFGRRLRWLSPKDVENGGRADAGTSIALFYRLERTKSASSAEKQS